MRGVALRGAGIVLALTVVSTTGAAPPAAANTTYRYRLVALAGGDAAANYDCHSTGCDVFSPGYETRVDWGLSMIFSDWGNVASIKRTVKARGSEWKDGTEAKYLAVEDNADAYRVPETDNDTGVKSPHYWCDINLHLRLYAPVRTAQLRCDLDGQRAAWRDPAASLEPERVRLPGSIRRALLTCLPPVSPARSCSSGSACSA